MKLVILSGPRQGLAFPLEGRPVRIGRDAGSTIPIDDSRASRKHAVIEPAEPGVWVIQDLGSTNHTYVNGRPVTRAVLREGDVIRVASTELRFVADSVTKEDLDDEISVEVDPLSIQAALRSSGDTRSGRVGLHEALFQIGMLADVAISADEFLTEASRILGAGVHHTSWAWIDWPDGPARPWRVRGARDGRALPTGDALEPSRSLIDKAMQRRNGLISSELGERFNESITVRRNRIASALAVPLLVGDRVRSVLYLDREDESIPFGREELEWVAILGAQISVHLENITLFRRLQDAYDELRRSQNELIRTEKLAAIGRLASGFAHDLNNPLSSILAFLELGERALPDPLPADLPEKLPHYLTRARAAADYCRALSRNLLAFARRKPLGEGEQVPFDVRNTIMATLDICHAALKASGAEVEVDLPSGISLNGDPSALQQVVMNLVTNAADAVAERKDEQQGKVFIRGVPKDDGLMLEIIDNGPGIPEELAARVFEALFTTKKDDRGTGLGLFVVRRIVEESGGTIEFTSEPGEGTHFIVQLPKKLARLGSEDLDPSTLANLVPAGEAGEEAW